MEVFVARQPIFGKNDELTAYELLYRNSMENSYQAVNHDQATADVIINSFLNIGIDRLSDGKPCFINFTENLLELNLPTYFPPREIVVEILETVPVTEQLIGICLSLKKQGYKIALDDFVFNKENPFSERLLKTADIIKVDFLNTPENMREQIESICKLLNLKLLAEKVETREEYELAKKLGYDYFQGYFFSKPIILTTHDVPSFFHSYYEIIQILSLPEPDIDHLTSLIEKDLSLSYKLLKLINMPSFRPKNKINSIRQAIVFLGLIEIQKWIFVLAVRDYSGGQSKASSEIARICLTRARACEKIASLSQAGTAAPGFFLAGMFSLMDSIMGVPMKDVLQELSLHEEISQALLGEHNIYKKILDLAIEVEGANWESAEMMCASLGFDSSQVFEACKEALFWSSGLLSGSAASS
ncbi:EAL and modified HD-GYP domain-containing signal transduction protein [Bacillus sp. OV322]|uniref:EAL and HDOD domain-containing protein n=1 Tax=Bacillus sp. OV322 TaxID=1882764 RepID=UPI0008E60330|nr:EAL domain-containing protein [Bacillus sp. OV322]SFC77480.1 EAL and modified HD-GYP domain-containing signal transduction protein [Bacillus sp. OV322]